MTASTTAKTSTSKPKIGETVRRKGKAFLVRLPGGTVVTARDTYTWQHEGKHAVILGDQETTYEVTAK